MEWHPLSVAANGAGARQTVMATGRYVRYHSCTVGTANEIVIQTDQGDEARLSPGGEVKLLREFTRFDVLNFAGTELVQGVLQVGAHGDSVSAASSGGGGVASAVTVSSGHIIVDSGTLTAVTGITNPVHAIMDSGTLTAVTGITNPVHAIMDSGTLTAVTGITNPVHAIMDSGTLTTLTGITNPVTVADFLKTRADAAQGFAWGAQLAGGAAKFTAAQIANPVGSGIKAYVHYVGGVSSGSARIFLQRYDTLLATNIGFADNKYSGGAASKCQVRSEQLGAIAATGRAYRAANAASNILSPWEMLGTYIVLPEGTALAIYQDVVNLTLDAHFEWDEL